MHTETKLLTALLAGIVLQGLLILATSALGIVAWSWIGSAAILLGLAAIKLRLWQASDATTRAALTEAWRAPWPWIIGLLLTIQIVAYPPTMSDSLCYRLPRLFLALQDGGIGRFPTEDDRINGMPWGWEFLALPFASLNLLNASKLINLAAWAIVYQLLFSLARERATSGAHARWIALALSTAPVFLLQATSTANDLYAATLLLIGAWMIHRFHTAPGPLPVMASLLTLVLAANAKPQFLILGLPWLVWWALAPGKPWKQTPWWTLAAAAPVYFLVSPLWILFENHLLHGNLLGASEGAGLTTKAPTGLMIVAGTIQFTASQFQLPVFPGAEAFSAFLKKIPGFAEIHAVIPSFQPEVNQLAIVDRASLGLVHITLLASGLVLCIRRSATRTWPWLAAFAFGFLIASSQVVPSTIGRSFVGFLALLLPLAAIGLASWSNIRITQAACIAAILTGTAALTLNPSSPLWPSGTTASIAKSRNITSLIQALDHYHGYQKRALTGTAILDPVPHGETVGVLVRRITPITSLWQPDWRAHRIEFINHLTPADFTQSDTRWLIVADNAAEFLPEQTAQYQSLPGWEKIQTHTYLPNLSQGHESWTLYRKSP